VSLITLFSAPKPFIDPHIATIQRNAIKSWTLLPDVEVILLGEEAGLPEAARELGVRHISNVARNQNGTPLVSSMFELTRGESDSPLLCIVNADILLMSDFVQAAQQAMKLKDRFVLMGRRWDLDVRESLDFSNGWDSRLRERAHNGGRFHRPAGSDYFIFPRACYTDIPDFAIGRAGWENWMIYKARREGWAVVDATPSIMIVHQNHDYSHLPPGMGKKHYNLPETDENERLAGGREVTRFTLYDANCRLSNGKLIAREWNARALRRAIETFPLLVWDNSKLSARLFTFFRRFRKKLSLRGDAKRRRGSLK